jgi:hypothetical protein
VIEIMIDMVVVPDIRVTLMAVAETNHAMMVDILTLEVEEEEEEEEEAGVIDIHPAYPLNSQSPC